MAANSEKIHSKGMISYDVDDSHVQDIKESYVGNLGQFFAQNPHYQELEKISHEVTKSIDQILSSHTSTSFKNSSLESSEG